MRKSAAKGSLLVDLHVGDPRVETHFDENQNTATLFLDLPKRSLVQSVHVWNNSFARVEGVFGTTATQQLDNQTTDSVVWQSLIEYRSRECVPETPPASMIAAHSIHVTGVVRRLRVDFSITKNTTEDCSSDEQSMSDASTTTLVETSEIVEFVKRIAVSGYPCLQNLTSNKLIPLVNLSSVLKTNGRINDSIEADILCSLALVNGRKLIQATEFLELAKQKLKSLIAESSNAVPEDTDVNTVTQQHQRLLCFEVYSKLVKLELLHAEVLYLHGDNRKAALSYRRATYYFVQSQRFDDTTPITEEIQISSDNDTDEEADIIRIVCDIQPHLTNIILLHLYERVEIFRHAGLQGVQFLIDILGCTLGDLYPMIVNEVLNTYPKTGTVFPIEQTTEPHDGDESTANASTSSSMLKCMSPAKLADFERAAFNEDDSQTQALTDAYNRLLGSCYELLPYLSHGVLQTLSNDVLQTHLLLPETINSVRVHILHFLIPLANRLQGDCKLAPQSAFFILFMHHHKPSLTEDPFRAYLMNHTVETNGSCSLELAEDINNDSSDDIQPEVDSQVCSLNDRDSLRTAARKCWSSLTKSCLPFLCGDALNEYVIHIEVLLRACLSKHPSSPPQASKHCSALIEYCTLTPMLASIMYLISVICVNIGGNAAAQVVALKCQHQQLIHRRRVESLARLADPVVMLLRCAVEDIKAACEDPSVEIQQTEMISQFRMIWGCLQSLSSCLNTLYIHVDVIGSIVLPYMEHLILSCRSSSPSITELTVLNIMLAQTECELNDIAKIAKRRKVSAQAVMAIASVLQPRKALLETVMRFLSLFAEWIPHSILDESFQALKVMLSIANHYHTIVHNLYATLDNEKDEHLHSAVELLNKIRQQYSMFPKRLLPIIINALTDRYTVRSAGYKEALSAFIDCLLSSIDIRDPTDYHDTALVQAFNYLLIDSSVNKPTQCSSERVTEQLTIANMVLTKLLESPFGSRIVAIPTTTQHFTMVDEDQAPSWITSDLIPACSQLMESRNSKTQLLVIRIVENITAICVRAVSHQNTQQLLRQCVHTLESVNSVALRWIAVSTTIKNTDECLLALLILLTSALTLQEALLSKQFDMTTTSTAQPDECDTVLTTQRSFSDIYDLIHNINSEQIVELQNRSLTLERSGLENGILPTDSAVYRLRHIWDTVAQIHRQTPWKNISTTSLAILYKCVAQAKFIDISNGFSSSESNSIAATAFAELIQRMILVTCELAVSVNWEHRYVALLLLQMLLDKASDTVKAIVDASDIWPLLFGMATEWQSQLSTLAMRLLKSHCPAEITFQTTAHRHAQIDTEIQKITSSESGSILSIIDKTVLDTLMHATESEADCSVQESKHFISTSAFIEELRSKVGQPTTTNASASPASATSVVVLNDGMDGTKQQSELSNGDRPTLWSPTYAFLDDLSTLADFIEASVPSVASTPRMASTVSQQHLYNPQRVTARLSFLKRASQNGSRLGRERPRYRGVSHVDDDDDVEDVLEVDEIDAMDDDGSQSAPIFDVEDTSPPREYGQSAIEEQDFGNESADDFDVQCVSASAEEYDDTTETGRVAVDLNNEYFEMQASNRPQTPAVSSEPTEAVESPTYEDEDTGSDVDSMIETVLATHRRAVQHRMATGNARKRPRGSYGHRNSLRTAPSETDIASSETSNDRETADPRNVYELNIADIDRKRKQGKERRAELYSDFRTSLLSLKETLEQKVRDLQSETESDGSDSLDQDHVVFCDSDNEEPLIMESNSEADLQDMTQKATRTNDNIAQHYENDQHTSIDEYDGDSIRQHRSSPKEPIITHVNNNIEAEVGLGNNAYTMPQIIHQTAAYSDNPLPPMMVDAEYIDNTSVQLEDDDHVQQMITESNRYVSPLEEEYHFRQQSQEYAFPANHAEEIEHSGDHIDTADIAINEDEGNNGDETPFEDRQALYELQAASEHNRRQTINPISDEHEAVQAMQNEETTQLQNESNATEDSADFNELQIDSSAHGTMDNESDVPSHNNQDIPESAAVSSFDKRDQQILRQLFNSDADTSTDGIETNGLQRHASPPREPSHPTTSANPSSAVLHTERQHLPQSGGVVDNPIKRADKIPRPSRSRACSIDMSQPTITDREQRAFDTGTQVVSGIPITVTSPTPRAKALHNDIRNSISEIRAKIATGLSPERAMATARSILTSDHNSSADTSRASLNNSAHITQMSSSSHGTPPRALYTAPDSSLISSEITLSLSAQSTVATPVKSPQPTYHDEDSIHPAQTATIQTESPNPKDDVSGSSRLSPYGVSRSGSPREGIEKLLQRYRERTANRAAVGTDVSEGLSGSTAQKLEQLEKRIRSIIANAHTPK